jgi:hypothetical protein
VNVTLLEATSTLVISNFIISVVTMIELNEELKFKNLLIELGEK